LAKYAAAFLGDHDPLVRLIFFFKRRISAWPSDIALCSVKSDPNFLIQAQAVGSYPQPTGHLGHTVASIRDLSDCLNFELLGIPFAAHMHLCHSHFV
jgi:hypothetical protein